MDYRLVLSNLKIVEFQLLVTIDNDASCHVILEDFPEMTPKRKMYFDLSIFNEKTKVNQFARLCRIMTCLFLLQYFEVTINLVPMVVLCILGNQYIIGNDLSSSVMFRSNFSQ